MAQAAQTDSANFQPALNGASVATLVTDGFEQVELTGPRDVLEQAGSRAAVELFAEVTQAFEIENGDAAVIDFQQACFFQYLQRLVGALA